MPAAAVQPRRLTAPLRSKRLLGLAGDERLVEQMRRGNELAFEIAFERHGAAILSFCRHMLGSRDEAEDALQHTFAAAWRNLDPVDEREIALKPWLFTIARNRCLSMLRSRRELGELPELSTAGLSDEVERRAELRELLCDIGELPAEQREALLLSEAGDLSHAEVAGVLGCGVPHVKSLVFRARSSLIARREARATPCEVIREQLANLRGPSLRRNDLRLHLADCPGCRAYREEVKRQRQLLAAALPVTPGGGLELSVLAAAGIGGGGAAAAGIGGGGALGLAGSSLLAKIALVGVMASGGITAEKLLVEDPGAPAQRSPAVGQEPRGADGDGIERARERAPVPAATRAQPPAARAGVTKPKKASRGGTTRAAPAAGVAKPRRGGGEGRGRKLGHEKQARARERGKPAEPPRGERAQGRGRVVKPPLPGPVRRGPAELPAPAAPKLQPAPGPKAVAPGQEAKALPPEPAAAQPTVLPNGKEKVAKE
jgi:RNA polymerase sigma factor (sigma-70 family)